MSVDFEKGIAHAANLLAEHRGKTLFIGSAYASMESNYLFGRLAKELGAEDVAYVTDIQEGSGDGWLIQDDKTPNAAACEVLGFKAYDVAGIKEKMADGAYTAVYALENNALFAALDAADFNGKAVLAHATHYADALEHVDVLLPAAIEIEGEGVYLNNKGIPQVSRLARQIAQMSTGDVDARAKEPPRQRRCAERQLERPRICIRRAAFMAAGSHGWPRAGFPYALRNT
jgi:NADH-quinone oxidoreductase subunit G